MSVKAGAAEGAPVSLAIAEQHPKDTSSVTCIPHQRLCLAEETAHGRVAMFGWVTAQVQSSGCCFISCASLELFLKRLSCLPHQTSSLVDSSQVGFCAWILCLTSSSLSPEGSMVATC